MKKDIATRLYFIALIPPSPIYEKALELKHYFKNRYNSKASLNSPPHITLHMPFQWKEKKEIELIESLKRFTKNYSPFDLNLLNFNCFPPRIIYIDVVKNEKLETLQKELQRFCKKELNLFNANYKEHAFHPHLTLAFRDLKKQNFLKAWDEFKEKGFNQVCTVNALALLKHDGMKWQSIVEFSLISVSQKSK